MQFLWGRVANYMPEVRPSQSRRLSLLRPVRIRAHGVTTSGIAVGDAAELDFVPEGERKLVTALFVDIINSTGLEQDLDPEEARAIVDPVLQLMINSVRRYDGYVVQSTGDGIFALFGAPVAHEDHPQRSLYAALRLQEEIRRLGERLSSEGRAPLQIRAGVNTGEVVVRPIKTGERHTEYTPIGQTVDLASRMQSLASAGAIVISDSTRKLVEGYFKLRSFGLPNSRKSAIQFRFMRWRSWAAANEIGAIGRSGLAKFVGRSQEKQGLRTLPSFRDQLGTSVAVVAEPGVGKSRLFFEFKAAAEKDWTVIEAFSFSHGSGSSYLPVIELLHGYFGIKRGEDQASRRAKVTDRVAQFHPSLDASLPYLQTLLEIDLDRERLAGMDLSCGGRGPFRLLLTCFSPKPVESR